MSADFAWLGDFCDLAEREYQAEKLREEYRLDPVKWVQDTTGETLWSKQREIYEAVVKYPKVAVTAGHGVGKSMSASRLGAWWVDVHPPEDTWLITTAPTWTQVQTIFWQELQTAHAKGGLQGRITGDCHWRIGSREVGMGRKPADQDAHGFQGIHRPFVLVVIDEACGVHGNMWEGAANITTADTCRILAIGNPDDPNTHFGSICEGAPTDGSSGFSNKGWYVIRISVLDNPRFSDEEFPDDLKHHFPGDGWIEKKKLEVGEGSALWTSKVLGMFPEDAADGVIPSSWVAACRYLDFEVTDWDLTHVHGGLDVAASDNGDRTTLWLRRGRKLWKRYEWQTRDHIKLAAEITNVLAADGVRYLKVDSTGVGHGLAQLLAEYGRQGHHKAAVYEVNFGARANDAVRFANTRAEMHWTFREIVQNKAIDLSAITDKAVAELVQPKYQLDPSGRVLITKKEEIIKILERSPDDADAILLCCYTPPVEAKGYTWKH